MGGKTMTPPVWGPIGRVRAARKLADKVSVSWMTNSTREAHDALQKELAALEAELAREEKDRERTVPISRPIGGEPGAQATVHPRPDVAALVTALRRAADDQPGRMLPYQRQLFEDAADALESLEKARKSDESNIDD